MRWFSLFGKSNILYFPGCILYFKFPENFDLYKEIFYKLGIDFRIIDKKICCGLPALEAGYEAEARKLIRRNFEIFKEENIKTIITSSSCCYKMFLMDYPEMLPEWNLITDNIWRIILNKLEEKPGLIENKSDETISYHDSCYLGRYCEIYDEPRKILKLIGYKINEMENSKSESFCCGNCGGLARTNPKLADRIAKERILQAKRTGVNKIIVSSISDYELLKKNSEETGVEIVEFSEVLASALGIPIIKKEPAEKKIILKTEQNANPEEELKEKDI